MNFKLKERSYGLCVCFLVLTTNGLSGCSTNKVGIATETGVSEDTAIGTTYSARDFVTPKDVERLKKGMTPSEVKSILGAPINFKDQSALNTLEQDNVTYAYVLREDRGDNIQVTPYELLFKKSKFLGFKTGNKLEKYGPVLTLQQNEVLASSPEVKPAQGQQVSVEQSVPDPRLVQVNSAQINSEPTTETQTMPGVQKELAQQNQELVPEKTVASAPSNAASQATAVVDSNHAQNVLTDEVVAAVQSWVQAWAGKNFEQYLDAYALDFQHGMPSRMAWEKMRRSRLAAPASITLTLSDIRILPKSASEVEVSFVQEYSSERMKEVGTKTLQMSKLEDKWKIRSEVFRKN